MAVTKSKAEMVVTWHERGVDIETTCRMLGVTPQEAARWAKLHARLLKRSKAEEQRDLMNYLIRPSGTRGISITPE